MLDCKIAQYSILHPSDLSLTLVGGTLKVDIYPIQVQNCRQTGPQYKSKGICRTKDQDDPIMLQVTCWWAKRNPPLANRAFIEAKNYADQGRIALFALWEHAVFNKYSSCDSAICGVLKG